MFRGLDPSHALVFGMALIWRPRFSSEKGRFLFLLSVRPKRDYEAATIYVNHGRCASVFPFFFPSVKRLFPILRLKILSLLPPGKVFPFPPLVSKKPRPGSIGA